MVIIQGQGKLLKPADSLAEEVGMILIEAHIKKNLPKTALSVIAAISVPNKWQGRERLSKHKLWQAKDQNLTSQTFTREIQKISQHRGSL